MYEDAFYYEPASLTAMGGRVRIPGYMIRDSSKKNR
jgi:hypothetical protein